ncbi:hypothetical protein [Salinarimonas ramus]|uniref:Uncharacterized protein n=1 Tax=Salinarimonas ramus TaxID=690164 RepID=A0A917Q5X0_9HYPH|nr:hypothetical protein [Salinarimonas ramus]GGK20019.1 hypothetical protein GCM10011322_03360 [Salinarimonas ramus]
MDRAQGMRRPEDALAIVEAALADIRALEGLLSERRVAAARRRLADVHAEANIARRSRSVRRP